ncbi:MAG TPA: hypothetical protein VGM53_03110 [Streptosporangiaceae bacterium]|jgi:hypothetical protein
MAEQAHPRGTVRPGTLQRGKLGNGAVLFQSVSQIAPSAGSLGTYVSRGLGGGTGLRRGRQRRRPGRSGTATAAWAARRRGEAVQQQLTTPREDG